MMRRLFVAFSGVATRGPQSQQLSSPATALRPPRVRPSAVTPLGASSRSRSLSFYSTPPELRPVTGAEESGDKRYLTHQYNRVERIILVRHGESLGNIDETSYGRLADWRIPLTEQGREQARAAGRKIRQMMDAAPPEVVNGEVPPATNGEATNGEATNGEAKTNGAANGAANGAIGGGGEDCEGCRRSIFFYVSPYLRTRQTLRGILDEMNLDCVIGLREEPRISEQQFGNYQCFESVKVAKAERGDFGRFYYRFPNGESGFDVYNRVSSFISTIFRDVQQLRAEGHDLDRMNICIVTHGLALRLILMRWFQYTVHEFEESFNPENGSVVVLERHTNPENGLQWYEVTAEGRERLNLPAFHEQSRFKVADDLSLLDKDFDEGMDDDFTLGPGNI